MKTKILPHLGLIFLFGIAPITNFCQTLTQIPSSTGTTSSNLYGPINRPSATSNVKFSKYAYLYTESEMDAAGIPSGATITKLSYNKYNVSGGGTNCAEHLYGTEGTPITKKNQGRLKIYLLNSTDHTYDSPSSWTSLKSGANLVADIYITEEAAEFTSGGWVEFGISGFTYTGGALEVFISWEIENPENTDPSISSGQFLWTYSSALGHALGAASNTSGGTSTLSSALGDNRPDCKFEYSVNIANFAFGTDIVSIEKNIYGFNLTQFFPNVGEHTALAEDIWPWVGDLHPQIFRFPAGANGKFMHPCKNDGTPNQGYGLDLCEIAQFYVYADHEAELGSCPIFEDTEDIDEFVADVDDLILNTGLQDAFDDFAGEYSKQFLLPPSTSYVNQLATLINVIESNIENIDIQVIYCANTLTAGEDELIATLDYMIDNGIDVIGVEIGNETYNNLSDQIFCTFGDYFSFITGVYDAESYSFPSHCDPPIGYPDPFNGYFEYISKVAPTLEINHNYIGALRTNFPDLLIGLPAAPVDYEEFIDDSGDEEVNSIVGDFCDCDNENEWNSTLEDKLTLTHDYGAGAVPFFDAIIAHIYLNPGNGPSEWGQDFADNFPSTESFCCSEYLSEYPDLRLQAAYKSILPHFNEAFRDGANSFSGIINTYNENAEFAFHFNNPTYGSKKLWVTEWKYNPSNLEELDALENTLLQAYLQFEWRISQYTINSNSVDDIYDNFLTISTIQSLLGGSEGDLISNYNSNRGDEPYPGTFEYLRRAAYYADLLLKPISYNNLKYVTNSSFTCNDGLIPDNQNYHMFFDDSNNDFYIFFSNMNQEDIVLQLDESDFDDYFPGYIVELEAPLGKVFRGDQLYSTLGKNWFYTYNTFYSDPANYLVGLTHLNNIIYEFPIYNISIPGHSMGYYKLGTNLLATKKDASESPELRIFPNPSNGNFSISINDSISSVNIDVYSISGILVESFTNIELETAQINFNLSNLFSGEYLINLSGEQFQSSRLITIQK